MRNITFNSDKSDLDGILRDIKDGKLQLPDFQRGWVWDDERIASILASISLSFPIGAIMTLMTGGEVNFRPRRIEGTSPGIDDIKPETLVLDGQQRLTSLFQALYCNNPVKTLNSKGKEVNKWYYLDMQKCVDDDASREEAVLSFPEDKVEKLFGGKHGKDVSSPDKEYEQSLFPANKVYNSAEWRQGYSKFWDYDSKKTKFFDDFERNVVKRFEKYDVPVISLSKDTPKEAVCLIFEKVNTGGVSLTVFELLTAMFAAENYQLRDDWEKRKKTLDNASKVLVNTPNVDFLQAIALLVTQKRRRESGIPRTGEKLPGISCKRSVILGLSVDEYKYWAPKVEEGFKRAARFLHQQYIFRAKDVPYRTQLIPLAAILVDLGSKGDSARAKGLLANWYWCGILGELYGSATESRFARDLPEVVSYISGKGTEPKTINDANFVDERLITLRTRNSAAYKGIYALLMRSGGKDFRTGEKIESQTFLDENIDIHHIFPRAWCEKHKLEADNYNSVINKTPLSARTNRIIGGKAPSEYLEKLKKDVKSSEEMEEILNSHHINIEHLAKDDFKEFFRTRAEQILLRIERAMGKEINRDEDTFDIIDSNSINSS